MKKLLILISSFCSLALAQSPFVLDLGSASKHTTVCPSQTGTGATGFGTLSTNYDFNAQCVTNQYSLPWSSGAMNSVAKLFFFQGGGHSDDPDNSNYVFNYHPGHIGWSTTWSHSAYCANGGSGSAYTADTSAACTTNGLAPNYCGALATLSFTGCTLATAKDAYVMEDSTPLGHAFSSITYIPTMNSIFASLNGNWGGQSSNYMFLFGCGSNPWSLGNCSWQWQDPTMSGTSINNNGGTSGSGINAAYDPANDVVWASKITTGLFYKYDPHTNTNTAYGQIETDFTDTFDMTAAVDPLHNRLWYFGTHDLSTIRAASINTVGSPVWTNESSNVGSECLPATGAGSANGNAWPGFDWDPLSSRFAVFSPDNSTTTAYWFDPVTKHCTTINMGGSIPAFPAVSLHQTSGRWRMIPDMPGKALYMPPLSTQDVYIATLEPAGLGASFINNSTGYCLDKDGDQYGVGPACLGPDADDNDNSIHSGPQAIAKYGSLTAFLIYRQYNPPSTCGGGSSLCIWFMAPASPSAACLANGGSSGSCTGNDSTGVVGDVNHPFLSYSAIQSAFNTSPAGHMIIARDAWSGRATLVPNGNQGSPVVWLAYPGEKPVLDPSVTAGALINCADISWVIIDGIATVGSAGYNCGSTVPGVGSSDFHDVIIRNIDGSGNGGGSGDGALQSFNGMINITFEDNVWHDTSNQHVVYIGSHTDTSSNVRFQRNVMYNANGAGFPAFQYNGRCEGCYFEQNVVYNVPNAGSATASFAFYNGVKDSFIRSNLVFNGSGLGMIFQLYDGDCYWGSPVSSGICPYAETGNVIENNTINVPAIAPDGPSVAQQPAIELINNSTGCPPGYSSHPHYPSSFIIGDTVMADPYLYTGGPLYTATSAGALSNPPGAGWTTSSSCTPAKQNSVNNNQFINNIFVYYGFYYSANYGLVLAPMCTIQSEFSGSGCTLDTGDSTLSTATFTNNTFWNTYTGGSGCYNGSCGTSAVATGPNCVGGCGWTGYSIGSAPWASGSSGNVWGDPKFVASDPSAYNTTPASFNLDLAPGSPALSLGTISGGTVPGADIFGTAFDGKTPNAGAISNSICSITPSTLGPWTVGQAPGTTFSTLNCGPGPFTWSISGFPLPSGLSLSSGGVISGTLTTSGTYGPTINVTDGGSNTTSITPTIIVNLAPSITNSSLPTGTQGVIYTSVISNPVPIIVSNGTAPFTCSLQSGTLPTGITVNSNCALGLNGTPTNSGTFNSLVLAVTDANGIVGTHTYSMTINSSSPPGIPRLISGKSSVSGIAK